MSLYRILLFNLTLLMAGSSYLFGGDSRDAIATPAWFDSLLKDDVSGCSDGDSESLQYDSDGFDPLVVSKLLGKYVPDEYDYADDISASDSEDESGLDDVVLDTGYTPENNPDLYGRFLAYYAIQHTMLPQHVKISKDADQEVRYKMRSYADIADMYIGVSQRRLLANKKRSATSAQPLDLWDEIALAGKI